MITPATHADSLRPARPTPGFVPTHEVIWVCDHPGEMHHAPTECDTRRAVLAPRQIDRGAPIWAALWQRRRIARAMALASQQEAAAARLASLDSLRGGQPVRSRVIVKARPAEPSEIPDGAARLAALELGTSVMYARGRTSDVTRLECEVCHEIVRVKVDGDLMKHPLKAATPCTGTQGIGEGVDVEVDSVIVRGRGWAAVWVNGSAAGAYYDRMGKVTLNQLKQLMRSSG